MARNKTLEKLLNDVRAEARLSLDPAHNVQVRDSHIIMIQREQERLWEDFAWPHLRVHRYIPLQAGQRYYDTDAALTEGLAAPAQQIPIERIEKIEVKSDGLWLPMDPEIRVEYYGAHDSMVGDRSWPPRAWKLSENDDLEIWPVPDQNASADFEGYLRITGIRALRPLVEPGDRADLDDRLLTLYCAGAILAAAGAKDAQIKLEAAQRHYARLKAGMTKAPNFNMFGTTTMLTRRTRFVSRYKPPVQS